jgi:hypothetical protein
MSSTALMKAKVAAPVGTPPESDAVSAATCGRTPHHISRK